MMRVDLYNAAGVIGAALVILVYLGTQQRWLSAEDWRFPFAILLGAASSLSRSRGIGTLPRS